MRGHITVIHWGKDWSVIYDKLWKWLEKAKTVKNSYDFKKLSNMESFQVTALNIVHDAMILLRINA